MTSNDGNKINATSKRTKAFAVFTCTLAIIAILSFAFAWFFNQRELNTLSWIKTPIKLVIGSGNNHSITQLDMGSIDANEPSQERTYVFCVYGEPIDVYSLQLANTTNIPFYYDIYRASYVGDDVATSAKGGTVVNSESKEVTFSFVNDDGRLQTERFSYNESDCVISAKPTTVMTSNEIKAHQSHKLSFDNADASKVQSNAEPLYWLAEKDGVKVMNPLGKHTETLPQYFLDYYVIRVRWDEGTVTNNKETDVIYLTASR